MTLTPEEKVLDVRSAPPGEKHDLILTAVGKLKEGEYVIFVTGHDPLPVRNQLCFMQRGRFDWEYLVPEPKSWRIKITRTCA